MISSFPHHLFAYLSLLLLVLLLLATVSLLRWRRRHRALQARHRTQLEENSLLAAQCAQLTGRLAMNNAFAADLSQAELTTRLQRPRLDNHQTATERSAPERYRYAQRLSRSGLTAEQIANLLAISPQEATQLVHLARLSPTP